MDVVNALKNIMKSLGLFVLAGHSCFRTFFNIGLCHPYIFPFSFTSKFLFLLLVIAMFK